MVLLVELVRLQVLVVCLVEAFGVSMVLVLVLVRFVVGRAWRIRTFWPLVPPSRLGPTVLLAGQVGRSWLSVLQVVARARWCFRVGSVPLAAVNVRTFPSSVGSLLHTVLCLDGAAVPGLLLLAVVLALAVVVL